MSLIVLDDALMGLRGGSRNGPACHPFRAGSNPVGDNVRGSVRNTMRKLLSWGMNAFACLNPLFTPFLRDLVFQWLDGDIHLKINILRYTPYSHDTNAIRRPIALRDHFLTLWTHRQLP